ncbi:MAG: CDP-alcohol phosphatidyltransferase family protein [Acidimicrobiia bacterium]|nr:CDP-alcohol phosphatidyltransferase family protein [Acidimicrobiia bacterium]
MSRVLAKIADGLTLLRLAIAIVLAPLVTVGLWSTVAILMALAWATDFADGRIARMAGGGTRLGRWDMSIDTAVGASLLLGLIFQGVVPDWVGFALLVIFGFLHLKGNIAASMLLQLAGFAPTLLILWEDRPDGWWSPFVAIVLIAVFDWRRLFFTNIPAFVRGLGGRFEGLWARPPS